MKQKPILFSTPMVKAILEGRKTMTRRIVKPQIIDCSNKHKGYTTASWKEEPISLKCKANSNEWYCSLCGNGIGSNGKSMYKCKYQIGDILWVRETFGYNHAVEFGKSPFVYKADTNSQTSLTKEKYYANGELKQVESYWHPSIHMPKEAARIWLEVTNVRVERLQDISDKDAVAEGIEANSRFGEKVCMWKNYLEYDGFPYPIHSFQSLWESINGKQSWEANPWVSVIEFKRIEKP